MRVRIAAAVAVSVAVLATPAQGALNRPQVMDPKGDVRGGIAELDIVSARWSTAGRGADRALVATLTLAAAPKREVPYVYDMKSEVRDCGTVWFQYTPGTVMTVLDDVDHPAVSGGDTTAHVWLECGDMVYDEMTFTLKGNTITWSVPLTLLPESVQMGSVFYDFSALADIGEPVTGHSAPGIVAQSADNAFGDGTWRMK